MMKIDEKTLWAIAIEVQERLKDKLNSGVDPTGETTRKSRGLWRSYLKTSIKGIVRDGNIDIQMLDYGLDLEFGTPHTVTDLENLKEWVKDKILKGKKYEEKTVERIAKNIQKQIETKGMRPFPFIRQTFHQDVIEIVKKHLHNSEVKL